MKRFYFCLCVVAFFAAPLAAQQEKEYLITAQELAKLKQTYLNLGELNQEQQKQIQKLADTLRLSKNQSALLIIKLEEAKKAHARLTTRLNEEQKLLAKLRASSRAFEKKARALIQEKETENSALRQKLKRRTRALILLSLANIAGIALFVFKDIIKAKLKLLPF